ncbi:hypothetical protein B0T14DRAFT_236894 [Immersiella caudata]|uniref:Uncharacterized protein n=1 Tax=Immersiella caudata TaxID=314043 RepID=A0AA39WSY9_9PEZI|nr:hypothetical protein B0T14DRAFT_236894 [Immersiella caudata]
MVQAQLLETCSARDQRRRNRGCACTFPGDHRLRETAPGVIRGSFIATNIETFCSSAGIGRRCRFEPRCCAVNTPLQLLGTLLGDLHRPSELPTSDFAKFVERFLAEPLVILIPHFVSREMRTRQRAVGRLPKWTYDARPGSQSRARRLFDGAAKRNSEAFSREEQCSDCGQCQLLSEGGCWAMSGVWSCVLRKERTSGL